MREITPFVFFEPNILAQKPTLGGVILESLAQAACTIAIASQLPGSTNPEP
jgi:hypothetical protein